ncbi:1-phosphofructokinase family hexose kinase [Marivita hallyeonensis]|uniref:Phosphofructokinase n=1 Tax=Marivita hallyeonensis TaxID=996342 RepID=A0A1M5NH52_9RHOB|nr:hexose kinase [Marivita hallyeonensis]SHG88894.1 6-phosphofructokinase [Marivita hallyeonensis]
MSAVLTITTNPAVDMATTVASVVAGPKLRCKAPRWDAGGGGVNVARAIRKLGGASLALVATGGSLGERLLALLAAEGVAALPVPVSAETRISFAVMDEGTGEQYRFGVPGEDVTEAEGAALLSAVADAARNHEVAVFSGSVAPGLPIDFVAQVQSALAPAETRLVVDTSAAALAQLLARPVGVHALRLDRAEAEKAAARPLDTIADCRDFAATLVTQGVAEIVVIGRGADGSVLVSKDRRIHAWGPLVPVLSKVGAGDTFVGAFSLSLSRGEPLDTALMRGVAGAAATVGTEGTALCDKDTADAIFAQCEYADLT